MATRNIEAIEHRGRVYVSLEDMRAYLVSLLAKADGAPADAALHHVLYQLAEIRESRPL